MQGRRGRYHVPLGKSIGKSYLWPNFFLDIQGGIEYGPNFENASQYHVYVRFPYKVTKSPDPFRDRGREASGLDAGERPPAILTPAP